MLKLTKHTKEKLETLEIALISYDIYNLSSEEEILKTEQSTLTKEIIDLKSNNNIDDGIYLKNKTELLTKEKDIDFIQKELLEKTEELGKLNTELNVLKEQRKNKNTKDNALELANLIESKASINKEVNILNEKINVLEDEIKHLSEEKTTYANNVDGLKLMVKNYEQTYSKRERDILTNKHKIELLKLEEQRGNNLPVSVKKILESKTLKGIHNIIGNVIDTKEDYLRALEIAVSSSKNFIITEDEESAKEAIRYLKNNNLGRATFFPLNVITRRYIDSDIKSILTNLDGYIGVLADLIKVDDKYKKIIYNQLGQVIVAEDLDSAIKISKKINRKYRIITLAGDVINVGGSLSGGASYKGRSRVMIMQEINNSTNIITSLEEANKKIIVDINDTKKDINSIEDKLYNIERELKIRKEDINNKNKELLSLKNKLEDISNNINNLESDDTSLDKKEESLINRYYETSSYKEKLELKLESLKKEIIILKDKINEEEEEAKYKNSLVRKKEDEVNEILVKLSRIDVKLDNLLNSLNSDYSITYEKARKDYPLELDESDARRKVNNYKAAIKNLGMVNLNAIEEYERVSTRYEFLLHQKEDLEKALATLFEIMEEMDSVMKSEFLKTFKAINEEFKKVFRELFKGGVAELRLTDEDILTTGIEIKACPPGKKLTTISLLSGGEKTLTAISLLFAIINVRTVPFCVFDEVEAALDEANVIEFGKYLSNYRNKTQFLIITHKKKTMEYADTLYGITMQESGVSKLVSVKLTNNEELI